MPRRGRRLNAGFHALSSASGAELHDFSDHSTTWLSEEWKGGKRSAHWTDPRLPFSGTLVDGLWDPSPRLTAKILPMSSSAKQSLANRGTVAISSQPAPIHQSLWFASSLIVYCAMESKIPINSKNAHVYVVIVFHPVQEMNSQ
ncbi:hypothetical protein BX600DRAFT_436545 [Xylariales sp. PMI_506]|nr:hypothetical protein BX600DRAFT_436545 [Xylariales sp. PMI_506]